MAMRFGKTQLKKHCIILDFENCGWIYKEDEVLITSSMFCRNPTPIQISDFITAKSNNEFINNINEDKDYIWENGDNKDDFINVTNN